MKKAFIIFLVLLLSVSFVSANMFTGAWGKYLDLISGKAMDNTINEAFCEETDGGNNIFVGGRLNARVVRPIPGGGQNIVNWNENSSYDYCGGDTTILEYYCEGKIPKISKQECPTGFVCQRVSEEFSGLFLNIGSCADQKKLKESDIPFKGQFRLSIGDKREYKYRVPYYIAKRLNEIRTYTIELVSINHDLSTITVLINGVKYEIPVNTTTVLPILFNIEVNNVDEKSAEFILNPNLGEPQGGLWTRIIISPTKKFLSKFFGGKG